MDINGIIQTSGPDTSETIEHVIEVVDTMDGWLRYFTSYGREKKTRFIEKRYVQWIENIEVSDA